MTPTAAQGELSLDIDAVPSMRTPPPGPRSRELLDRMQASFYPGLTAGLAPFVVARKRGWAVEDVDGNVYLDLISASASVPLGACRDDLIEPAVEMLRRYGNEDSHGLASELMAPLAERLLAIAPRSLTRVDIALNGTEAIEIALKLMRRATGRQLVIAFYGAYHGESTMTATLGAERQDISSGLRQLSPGFVHVPYPNPYRSPFGDPRPGGSGDATIDYLRDHVLFHAVDPRDVAGVVIEPIIGSGGVQIPPDGFWPALVELCREHGWLLCADEVKSGMGRTGTMFAVEHWGVEPDMMCLGKGIGGGVMPLGAVLGSERAMGGYDDVPTGSTWAWLPAACAAALATLDVFEQRAGARERAGAGRPRPRDAGQAARAVRGGRRRPHQGLLHGGRVRLRPRDQGARAGAAGGGRRGVPAPRPAGRLQHRHLQPAAVAGDAGGGARPRGRDPGRGDRDRAGSRGGPVESRACGCA